MAEPEKTKKIKGPVFLTTQRKAVSFSVCQVTQEHLLEIAEFWKTGASTGTTGVPLTVETNLVLAWFHPHMLRPPNT